MEQRLLKRKIIDNHTQKINTKDFSGLSFGLHLWAATEKISLSNMENTI